MLGWRTDAVLHQCGCTQGGDIATVRISYIAISLLLHYKVYFLRHFERKGHLKSIRLTEQETSDSRRSGRSSFRRPRFFRGVEGAESSSAPGGVSVLFLWVESGEESSRSRFFTETRLSASPLHPACFIQATPSITRPQLFTYQEREMREQITQMTRCAGWDACVIITWVYMQKGLSLIFIIR